MANFNKISMSLCVRVCVCVSPPPMSPVYAYIYVLIVRRETAKELGWLFWFWNFARARAATVQQHAAASLLLHSNTSLLAKKEYKYYLYLDGRPFHVDGTVPFFTSRLHVEAWMLCESVGARPTFYGGLPTNCCCSNTNLSISSPPPLPPSTLLVSIAFAIISALLCAKA